MANGYFTMENGDFTMENGDFMMASSSWACPMRLDHAIASKPTALASGSGWLGIPSHQTAFTLMLGDTVIPIENGGYPMK